MPTTDFLIIDTYNMIIRSKTPWTKVEGANLVVLSFLRMLKKALTDFNPSKVIMPLDDYIGNSFRKQLLPEYKAHRVSRNKNDPFNDDFRKQKEIILNLLEKTFPVYTLKYKGYEADDIIAQICRIASDNVNIIVWSNDKDLIQLQQQLPNVKIWNPQSKDFFENPKYNIVTYKSLVGDRSDNIPGVKGMGKKTAEKVLESPREFIRLVASKTQRYGEYRLNKRLVDLIDNDLAIPDNLHYILGKRVKYDEKAFKQLISENNFDSILNQVETFNQIFFDLQLKNANERKEWFFNKQEVK